MADRAVIDYHTSTASHPPNPRSAIGMLNIDSEQGRIGILDLGMMVRAKFIRWGTWGLGRNIRIVMEPINDRF